ncbi:hypothetical protein C2E25_12280 [Geothermobacter hydrogeniphilus]|uniref:Uncharacterized protein n=1 Tax=Geothermobacter hydrogeniphilus TaxID=1969733 RepID=A0A2K2H872_9BACT|nr:hypothetical protein C2E25_12280 [Geothermobacter hydrogeniphilus]
MLQQIRFKREETNGKEGKRIPHHARGGLAKDVFRVWVGQPVRVRPRRPRIGLSPATADNHHCIDFWDIEWNK